MIRAELHGDAEVVAKLNSIPPRIREELRVGIGRLALKLARKVQREKLSGKVLKVRSGRLRRSINDVVVDEGEKVSGIVSTPVKYAPPHEYGFNGTVTVKAHLRTIKQAFGRAITARQVAVSEHKAKMNLPERSFLRTALAEMQGDGEIQREIDAAMTKALA